MKSVYICYNYVYFLWSFIKNIFTLPIKREKKKKNSTILWPCILPLAWDMGVILGLCFFQIPWWTWFSPVHASVSPVQSVSGQQVIGI